METLAGLHAVNWRVPGMESLGGPRDTSSARSPGWHKRWAAARTGDVPEAWDAVLEELVRTLDAMHPAARRARGDGRSRIIADLEALDASLMNRARDAGGADLLAEAAREATAELEPFAARLSPAAYAAAHLRCENRALRERLRLPTLTLE